MPGYEIIILVCWATFLVFWVVSAFNVKRDVRGGFGGMWRQYWWLRLIAAAVIVFAATRLSPGTAHNGSLSLTFFHGIFPENPWLGWIAAILSVVGVVIAIWARVHLGRNWSPMPSVKEQHELVTSGPYAYVRHPIYTGVILMAFATAITGSIFGIIVFIFASLLFILRIGKEEKIMLELFPNQYPEYRKRTKRLVPWVW